MICVHSQNYNFRSTNMEELLVYLRHGLFDFLHYFPFYPFKRKDET